MWTNALLLLTAAVMLGVWVKTNDVGSLGFFVWAVILLIVKLAEDARCE